MLTLKDETHFCIRSLSVDYASGSQLPNHSHDWSQLIYCRNGAIRCQLERNVWIVPPRRAIWLPPGETHQLSMIGEVQLRTLYLSAELQAVPGSVTAVNVSNLFHEAILKICSFGMLDERVRRHRVLRALVEDEILASTSTLQPLPMPSDSRARLLALRFLDPVNQTSMLSMISDVGLSRRTAERLFSEETGMTPAGWYRQARLSNALQYLLTGYNVMLVAEKCGYKSRSAFSRAFLRFHGVSPREVLASDASLTP